MAESAASSTGPAAELRCAFYCFFDDVIGRTLAAQEPPEYITSEQFDAISDYLIPKPQLCGRLLTLRVFGQVVLCWPTCIENNKKYARNALIFSLGLVLQPAAGDEGAPHRYGEVLGRAAACSPSSSASRASSRRGATSSTTCCRSCSATSARGRCTLAVDASHAVELALPPRPPPPPPPPQDHLAPVLVAEPPAAAVRGWDLALQRLLPLMDGTQPVARIAAAACVDVALARRATATLQAGGCVPPPALLVLAALRRHRRAPRRRARARRPQAELAAARRPPAPAPPFAPCCAARRLCPADDGWRTVRAVCEALHALAAQVDVRALVTAALLNGLLRAVDVVPVVPRQMRRDSAGGGALGGGRSRGWSTAARRSPRSRASSTSAPPTSSAASSPRSTAARPCSDSREAAGQEIDRTHRPSHDPPRTHTHHLTAAAHQHGRTESRPRSPGAPLHAVPS